MTGSTDGTVMANPASDTQTGACLGGITGCEAKPQSGEHAGHVRLEARARDAPCQDQETYLVKYS